MKMPTIEDFKQKLRIAKRDLRRAKQCIEFQFEWMESEEDCVHFSKRDARVFKKHTTNIKNLENEIKTLQKTIREIKKAN